MFILDLTTNDRQSVKLLQYTAWPDAGVPDSPDVLFHMISTLKQWNPQITLIHCSAGVGRTGVFIALSRLIDQIKLNAEYLDVHQTVLNLRKDRYLMVKEPEQYKFLYSALADYIPSVDVVSVQRTSRSSVIVDWFSDLAGVCRQRC